MKSDQIRSFCGPYFPVFSPTTGKYGPEKTPYLHTFQAVDMVDWMEGNILTTDCQGVMQFPNFINKVGVCIRSIWFIA